MRLKDLAEAFNDIGKLTDLQLAKGQRLEPNDASNFRLVDGRTFYRVVSKMSTFDSQRSSPRGLSTLSHYGVQDFNKMKCFLGQNNTSGYCINHGDELVSVFSTSGSSGRAIVADAIRNGVKRLDCFAIRTPDGRISGPLPALYG